MTAYFDAMGRYFTFSGRSTRGQFWTFYLVLLVLGFATALLDQFLGTATAKGGVLIGVVSLVHLISAELRPEGNVDIVGCGQVG